MMANKSQPSKNTSPQRPRIAQPSSQASGNQEERSTTISRPNTLRSLVGRPLNQAVERSSSSTSAADRVEIERLNSERQEWESREAELAKKLEEKENEIRELESKVNVLLHNYRLIAEPEVGRGSYERYSADQGKGYATAAHKARFGRCASAVGCCAQGI
jgi:predicted ribosome quality control (RQC) complex YloA/Tae2 family protein